MKKVTLKALKASIRHWEMNLNLAREDSIYNTSISTKDCALCDRFNNPYKQKEDCTLDHDGERCPVYIRSGHPFCTHSPYTQADEARRRYLHRHISLFAKKNREKVIKAFEAEVDFLKSLLPKEE